MATNPYPIQQSSRNLTMLAWGTTILSGILALSGHLAPSVLALLK